MLCFCLYVSKPRGLFQILYWFFFIFPHFPSSANEINGVWDFISFLCFVKKKNLANFQDLDRFEKVNFKVREKVSREECNTQLIGRLSVICISCGSKSCSGDLHFSIFCCSSIFQLQSLYASMLCSSWLIYKGCWGVVFHWVNASFGKVVQK